MSKQNHLHMDGTVTEALGHENWRVELDNGVVVLATISGKMRKNRIKIIPGDCVQVEVSPYDLTRGRIAYRYRPTEKNI